MFSLQTSVFSEAEFFLLGLLKELEASLGKKFHGGGLIGQQIAMDYGRVITLWTLVRGKAGSGTGRSRSTTVICIKGVAGLDGSEVLTGLGTRGAQRFGVCGGW